MAKFELVSKFAGQDDLLPVRKTKDSAGYDFIVAEDTLIPPYDSLVDDLYYSVAEPETGEVAPMTLDEMAALTKKTKAKPTLVPTGVKCKMASDEYLELMAKSSTPLKYWIIMANSVGIIDSDYADNPENEGLIFVEVINLSPIPIILKRGDSIAQGIVHRYIKMEDDNATGKREGGFGSTSK